MDTDNSEIRPPTGPELYRRGLFHSAMAASWATKAEYAENDDPDQKSLHCMAMTNAATAQAFFAGAQAAALAHMYADTDRANVAIDEDAFAAASREWLDLAQVTERESA